MFDLRGEELVVFRLPLTRSRAALALSSAEREVAELAVLGLSNLDIARRRGTTRRTVANQLASVFRKLGVGSRKALAVRWLREGS